MKRFVVLVEGANPINTGITAFCDLHNSIWETMDDAVQVFKNRAILQNVSGIEFSELINNSLKDVGINGIRVATLYLKEVEKIG